MTVNVKAFDYDHPVSSTVQNLLKIQLNHHLTSDLLFLERWEISPQPGIATARRISQIRRANPELAEAIRRELAPSPPRPSGRK